MSGTTSNDPYSRHHAPAGVNFADLMQAMAAFTEFCKRANEAGVLSEIYESEVLLATRAYAALSWELLQLLEGASWVADTAGGVNAVLREPFDAFTKRLFYSNRDAGRLRDALAAKRQGRRPSL